jgi:F0F1-type ATP synthase membrane subunit b/b'
MANHKFQPIMEQLKETAEAALKICRSLEIGQAIQPCATALEKLLGDDQTISLAKTPCSEGCKHLAIPLRQAQDRAVRDLKWLRERIAGMESPRTSLSPRNTGSEKDAAKLKEQLTIGFTKIDKSMTLATETSIQPLGSWTRFLREATGDFDLCDMEKTQSSTTLKLGINAGHLSKITRRIEHELRTQLNLDLRRVQDETGRHQRKTLLELGVPESEFDRFALPKSAERDVWRSIENLIAVGKESQIEFQRRSVFDILTAGRQKVFMVIMFLSLMGRMGLPNLFATPGAKLIFGLFLGSVMLSSMISSILLWRREKIEQGEKELKKIRETLLQDGIKIVEQSERNKLTAVRDYLKEALSVTETAYKSWSEELATNTKVKTETLQANRESHRKALEERIKMTNEAERGLAKLLDRVSDLAKQHAANHSQQTTSIDTSESMEAEVAPVAPSVLPSRHGIALESPMTRESSMARVSGLAARRTQRMAT